MKSCMLYVQNTITSYYLQHQLLLEHEVEWVEVIMSVQWVAKITFNKLVTFPRQRTVTLIGELVPPGEWNLTNLATHWHILLYRLHSFHYSIIQYCQNLVAKQHPTRTFTLQ